MSAPFTIEPFKFDIGPVPITGFGLAVLLSFGIAHIVSQRELAARGHAAEAEAIPDIVTAALLGTLVGAKLTFRLAVDEPNEPVTVAEPEDPLPSSDLPGG